MENKSVLTFKEVCEYTGFKASYLYKLTSTGKIPCSKPMGKMVFFDRVELEKFLLSNPQKTVEQIDMEASTRVTLSRGGRRK